MNPLRSIPPVVKGLLIINVAMFLATWLLQNSVPLVEYLSLYYPTSPNFRPYQLITHLFMHGGIQHIFFNMFALFMFGSMLENVWGPKRFLFFYLYCGLGAAAIQLASTGYSIWHMQDVLNVFLSHPTPASFDSFVARYSGSLTDTGTSEYSQILAAYKANPSFSDQAILFAKTISEGAIDSIKNVPTLGASGAIFGLLVAFGYLFPNTELYLMFIPIPIKAKYAVAGYAALELFFGFSGYEPGVAHFAHLGGALFGFLLVLYWNRRGKTFY